MIFGLTEVLYSWGASVILALKRCAPFPLFGEDAGCSFLDQLQLADQQACKDTVAVVNFTEDFTHRLLYATFRPHT